MATPTVSNVKAEPGFWPAVGDDVWGSITSEFGLPPVEDVTTRFQGRPEPPQLFRVFIGEGTFCPGFQFRDGEPNPQALRLFDVGMDLKDPHNILAAWMVTPLRSLAGARRVDALHQTAKLERELSAFADWHRPRPAKR
jgi:hypothetical protein